MSDSRPRDDNRRSSHNKDSSSSNRSREDRERERLARRSGNEDSTSRNRDGDSGRSRDLDQDRDRDRDRRRDRERESSPRGSRDGERDRRRDQDRVRDRERDRQIFSSSSSSRNREDPKDSISAHQSTSRINKEPLDMNLDYGRPDDELESNRNRNSDKGRISSSNHRSERNDDARERNRRDDRYRDDRSGRGVKFDDRSLPPSTDSTKSRSRIEVLESQYKSTNGPAPNGPSKDSRSNPSGAAPPQVNSNSASTSSSSKSILKRSPTPDIDYEMEMMSKEEREEKLLEERRKKRKEILEKYNKEEEKKEESKESVSQQSTATTIDKNSNSKFSLEKSNQDPKSTGNQVPNPSELQISAADYDPSKDMESDAKREEKKVGHNHFETQGSGNENGKGKAKVEDDDDDEWEEIEVEEDEDDVEDMFALDDDDNNGEEKKKKTKIIRVRKGEKRDVDDKKSKSLKAQAAPAHGLSDNWDDSDGYYRVTLGERMGEGGRYQVSSILGRGMFSEVVRAKDTRSLDYNKEVAIKIVRIQESMYKAGLKEISILKKLRELDPNDKKHVINLENSFDFKGHLCLVFENLNMNLRELIKRFGKDVGINLRAVRTYCHQMFLALSLLKKGNFMHADIKPDNILVDESKTTLKVCDLGSASHVDEMEITPYLVSRFYRAPEIILGAPYDPSLDVWSIGCTLYELFTGKILFPGRSNNQMLLLMQELKGKITNKQLRKSKFSKQHFDEETNVFLSRERDRNTGADVIRKIAISKPTSDLRSRILPPETQKTLSEEDLRLTLNFIDLLNKTLELDPNKRITPNAALSHPFCTG